ncbi:hypothetical protein EDB87DRAFT_768979 [Lactarius vividus]|nr:hypothetical protein EDB87DRAFT_768979 [Lactarius vividus]
MQALTCDRCVSIRLYATNKSLPLWHRKGASPTYQNDGCCLYCPSSPFTDPDRAMLWCFPPRNRGMVGSDGVLSAVVGDDGPLANQLCVRRVSRHVNDHETLMGSKKKWSRRRWTRRLLTLELCLEGASSKHAHWYTAGPAGHIASAPVRRFSQLLPCMIPFYYNSARSSSCSFWVRSFVRRLLIPHLFLRVPALLLRVLSSSFLLSFIILFFFTCTSCAASGVCGSVLLHLRDPRALLQSSARCRLRGSSCRIRCVAWNSAKNGTLLLLLPPICVWHHASRGVIGLRSYHVKFLNVP